MLFAKESTNIWRTDSEVGCVCAVIKFRKQNACLGVWGKWQIKGCCVTSKGQGIRCLGSKREILSSRLVALYLTGVFVPIILSMNSSHVRHVYASHKFPYDLYRFKSHFILFLYKWSTVFKTVKSRICVNPDALRSYIFMKETYFMI